MAVMAVCSVASGWAGAASSAVVVSADVPSASVLTNSCTSASATSLGVVLPSSNSTTATGTGACRVGFGSSNDSSQLRISQSDGAGAAMGLGAQPPAQLGRSNAPGRVYGIFAANANLVWSVGRSSLARRTTTAFGTAAEFSVGGTNLNDVESDPSDPNTWWFVGDNRTVYRTTNGQAGTPTFTNQSGALASSTWPSSMDVEAITIPVSGTMVIVGEGGWIARSTDSGASWTAFQSTDPTVDMLVGVDAASASDVMAVSQNGHVLSTATGGGSPAAWAVSLLPGSRTMQDIAMGAANRAFAVGSGATAFSWDGATWTDRSAATGAWGDIVGVDAMPGSPDGAWIVDEFGGVYRTTDLGATWTLRGSDVVGRPGDIHAGSATAVFVNGAGRQESASSDGGDTWSRRPVSANGITLPGITASPTNGRIAIAVGGGGRVRRTSDGGTTWTQTTIGDERSMSGVSLASDTVGWAVGDGGLIRRTNDAGATWTTQAAPAGVTGRLTAVAAIDAWRAVAVGHGGVVIATTNGGSTWTTRSSGVSVPLASIARFDDTLIAVGAPRTVIRSVDGGVTWSTVPGGSLPASGSLLADVTMASAQVGYIALMDNRVWRTADAGVTWTQVAGVTAGQNRGVAARGSTVVVVGLDDVSSRSTDSGATFVSTTGASTMHLMDVAMLDSHSAYATGADEVLERVDADPAAGAQVGDWSSPARDWDSGGFFGVCLQAVASGVTPDWTVDAANVAGTCEQLDTDAWQALPATSSKVGHLATPGLGSVDLVWGFRATATQAPGRYEAGVSFEALAPDA
ncbi:MAG: hypothetical protein JWM98_674 [Thermoleophilia bacterium]|nr:hypothetical protein [Thermoleophilia bacterium]